jgi:oligopeptide transport system permease protein
MNKSNQGRSLWADARKRLFANKAAFVALIALGFMALLSTFGPLLSSHPFDSIYWDFVSVGPNFKEGFPFGTDANGRDLFVRTMYGARISLMVALVASLVSLMIGVTYGAISGFIGGKTDTYMMRIVDVFYSLPYMFFVILLMVFFGRKIYLIFIAIGAVEWLDMARIVRGQTLSLKRKEFVEAAVAGGLTKWQIIIKHIIPNTLGSVAVFLTLTVPKVILLESFLSFLGLGIQEPMTSWGVLISEGADQMETAWWSLFFPATFLAITLFCFNYVGDGLRDALDPKDR